MRMMLAAAASTLALAGASSAQEINAPAGTYTLDRAHAQLHWRVMHLGLSRYTARIVQFDATLQFDPNDPDAISVTATIDPTSVSTHYLDIPADRRANDTDFDAELQNDNWFNSGPNPEITFVSTGVSVDESYSGPGLAAANVQGDLTVAGITQPVTMDVVLNGAGPHPFTNEPMIGFSGTATVSRADFGMTALQSIIADEVEIMIEAEFVQR